MVPASAAPRVRIAAILAASAFRVSPVPAVAVGATAIMAVGVGVTPMPPLGLGVTAVGAAAPEMAMFVAAILAIIAIVPAMFGIAVSRVGLVMPLILWRIAIVRRRGRPVGIWTRLLVTMSIFVAVVVSMAVRVWMAVIVFVVLVLDRVIDQAADNVKRRPPVVVRVGLIVAVGRCRAGPGQGDRAGERETGHDGS